MCPVVIPAALALPGRGRLSRITLQPVENVVVITLAVPQHAGERLPLDAPRIFVVETGVDSGVKLIGLANPVSKHLLESGEGIG